MHKRRSGGIPDIFYMVVLTIHAENVKPNIFVLVYPLLMVVFNFVQEKKWAFLACYGRDHECLETE